MDGVRGNVIFDLSDIMIGLIPSGHVDVHGTMPPGWHGHGIPTGGPSCRSKSGQAIKKSRLGLQVPHPSAGV